MISRFQSRLAEFTKKEEKDRMLEALRDAESVRMFRERNPECTQVVEDYLTKCLRGCMDMMLDHQGKTIALKTNDGVLAHAIQQAEIAGRIKAINGFQKFLCDWNLRAETATEKLENLENHNGDDPKDEGANA